MTPAALLERIASGESQTLEFKTSFDKASIESRGGVELTFAQNSTVRPESRPESPPESVTGGVGSEKSSEKSSEKILRHLGAEPTLSAKQLAEKLGISARAVEKQIDLLKKEGSLRRIGPAKGGHWQVLE
jgi:predicted HTH transcriptional regulator